jgi:hypothetical protein
MNLCRFILFFLFSFACANEFRVITTEYSPNLGMFATANQVLGQLYLFETGSLFNVSGVSVDFKQYGLYYDPSYGPNWWTYYFEPIWVGIKENAKIMHLTREQYFEAWSRRYMISREKAARIVHKYIRIKPHILQKVDAFAMQFFGDSYVIGIHYRGTDKYKEAPRVAYERVFQEIEKHIPLEKPYVFFIATDEADFLEQAQARYGNLVVATEAHRSNSNEEGIHFSYKNNYIVGQEALIDACLLSRCNLLIRTSSSLSLWSTYLNPDLPVILLNQRHIKTLEPE